MSFALLMPAAGSGVRLGAELPKALIPLAGIALFIHALRPFFEFRDITEAIIAAPVGFEDEFLRAAEAEFSGHDIRVVTGGAIRQESVWRAFQEMRGMADTVLIHDAARALVTRDVIRRVLDGLENNAAAVPGVPIVDTVKRFAGNPPQIIETVDRRALVAVQTPQALRRTIAIEAYRRAAKTGYTGTDDVSLVEHFGLGIVQLVEGDPRNFKITTREDLDRARLLLEQPLQ